ncbi:MAG: hypothetical protein RI885_2099 [Actinomycetota bacterium]|jgi:selenocysteine lyase/cysteine desulfurase
MTSAAFTEARAQFSAGAGYLAAASMGLPPRVTVAALRSELEAWARAQRSPADYDAVVERTRASFAALTGVDVGRVALGSQTSVLASVIAAAVPTGGTVLCVDGDFSSIVFPFLQRHDVVVRHVSLTTLADAIDDDTWLVAFSHIQSSSGEVADVAAVVAAAARHGARTLCDLTQSAGVHPVDASLFDATVCHAYKWLCAPRGAAFLTLSEEFQAALAPVHAGWFAGRDPWQSCYGPTMDLAPDARRFDVSPAWAAWVGAETSVALFAGLDLEEVWAWGSGLGDELCEALGIPLQHQAIVTWPDPAGHDLRTLTAAGIRAAGRAGRLRASFHLWNDSADVDAVARALR